MSTKVAFRTPRRTPCEASNQGIRKLSALVLLLLSAAGCAPRGYVYQPGSFTPTPAYPTLQQAAPSPPTVDASPTGVAIRTYCARAPALACAAYTGKVVKCPNFAAAGYGMLSYQRAMRQAGATPNQAAEMSVKATAGGPLPLSIGDRIYIAKRAMAVSASEPLEKFRDDLLRDCIAAVGD